MTRSVNKAGQCLTYEYGAEMCVLLCANPKVHEWLDITLARSCRQTYQLCTLCPDEAGLSWSKTSSTSSEGGGVKVLDKVAETHVMKRSAWIQAYFHCRHLAHQRRSSQQDWHKTLDALANAWGRFLSLVGLRW